jgi:hypothetical protein
MPNPGIVPRFMEASMRISDDRYNRDRLRFDLAMRMMRHHSRTATIRAWTGLSEDRIRKLYKAYLLQQPSGLQIRRRGKAPRQAVYFLQTAALCFEATTLASLLHAAGLVPLDDEAAPCADGPGVLITLGRAQTFCEAYETYIRLCPAGRLSFEHTWFLVTSLVQRDRIRLRHCNLCGRLYLAEAGRAAAPSCGCGQRQTGWPRRGRLPLSIINAYDGGNALAHERQRGARTALQSG